MKVCFLMLDPTAENQLKAANYKNPVANYKVTVDDNRIIFEAYALTCFNFAHWLGANRISVVAEVVRDIATNEKGVAG